MYALEAKLPTDPQVTGSNHMPGHQAEVFLLRLL